MKEKRRRRKRGRMKKNPREVCKWRKKTISSACERSTLGGVGIPPNHPGFPLIIPDCLSSSWSNLLIQGNIGLCVAPFSH